MTEVVGTYFPIGLLIHIGWSGPDPAFEAALEGNIDFVAADGGSTDAGPGYLGSATGMVYREGLRQAFDYLLSLTVPRNIPVLVGSANMGGTRDGLRMFREVIEQVARTRGLKFRAAIIDSELDKDYIKRHIGEGRVRPLDSRPELSDSEVDASSHIVGLMGTEPYVEALNQGATVIIGGRTSDPALFAAVPLWKGIPLNVAWHMGKVTDHGTVNIEPVPGVETWSVGIAADDHFRIEATHPNGRCSALRVARATLHENANPLTFYEPPGRIDIDTCTYEQVDGRTVSVRGTKFTPLPYTIKMEGAKPVGYRTITICGYRNPGVTSNVSARLQKARENIEAGAKAHGIDSGQYRVVFHTYGNGEVLADWEPAKPKPPYELGIVGDCVAETQDMAQCVAAMAHWELHKFGSDAFLFSPSDIPCGPVYEFNVWHLVEPDSPFDCCTIDYIDF